MVFRFARTSLGLGPSLLRPKDWTGPDLQTLVDAEKCHSIGLEPTMTNVALSFSWRVAIMVWTWMSAQCTLCWWCPNVILAQTPMLQWLPPLQAPHPRTYLPLLKACKRDFAHPHSQTQNFPILLTEAQFWLSYSYKSRLLFPWCLDISVYPNIHTHTTPQRDKLVKPCVQIPSCVYLLNSMWQWKDGVCRNFSRVGVRPVWLWTRPKATESAKGRWLNKVLTPIVRSVITCANATTTPNGFVAGLMTLGLASHAVGLRSRAFCTWQCCVEFSVDEQKNLMVLDGPYAIELNMQPTM